MHTAIRWFANNSVAANLLMIVMVLGGISGALTTNQEEFPNSKLRLLTFSYRIWAPHRSRLRKLYVFALKRPLKALRGSKGYTAQPSRGLLSSRPAVQRCR